MLPARIRTKAGYAPLEQRQVAQPNGEVDPISGPHVAAAYRQLVPHPDVVMSEQIGHYPNLKIPGGLLDALVTFADHLP